MSRAFVNNAPAIVNYRVTY